MAKFPPLSSSILPDFSPSCWSSLLGEGQEDPEKVVDVMEEKLKRAIKLNKFCSERLKNVQTILDQYKAEANVGVENNIENSTNETSDDDIPF